MEKNRTAIILLGGGMKSAHGAGFLYALATKLRITSPDIIIGTSGNAGNALYFASGQYESLRNIWLTLLPKSKFISFMRPWRVMDIDYLVDEVFKKQDPLDVARLAESPIEWLVPITDFDAGTTRYMSAADHADPFEILRAAKAVPVLFGKKIPLFGRRFFDGEIGRTLEDHVRQAVSRGAGRILVVSNLSHTTKPYKLFMELWARTIPNRMRDAVIRDLSADAVCLTMPGTRIICIVPQHLPSSIATHDAGKLRATFDRGIADALAHESELRTLLST